MLRIGDFSRLARVSIKTLRYYDQLGLLAPVQVDANSGYRYYASAQLADVNRILALKELGLTLEQVRELLQSESLSAEQIRGMLLLSQKQAEEQIREQRARIAMIENRLRLMDVTGVLPEFEIVVQEIEPMLVATVRCKVDDYREIGGLLGQIFDYLRSESLDPQGPPLVIYHDGEYHEQDADVEAAVPVRKSTAGNQDIVLRELTGGKMAVVVYQGSYRTLHLAYAAIARWIEHHDYRICGPNREIYLRGPSDRAAPETFITQIQFPVCIDSKESQAWKTPFNP